MSSRRSRSGAIRPRYKETSLVEELTGTTVSDLYELKSVLGVGGMGIVFDAVDLSRGSMAVAVKVLVDVADDGLAARFVREAKVLARIRQEHVVEIYDCDVTETNRPYFVMERLFGETLAAGLAREPLSESEALLVLSQVCEGLAEVHAAGVVHRDLTPQNIFLARPSIGDASEAGQAATGFSVKVLDFGIAKVAGSMTVQTQTSVVLGTPHYMSPEQARGEYDLISPRADIFSLGVVGYELFSGLRPSAARRSTKSSIRSSNTNWRLSRPSIRTARLRSPMPSSWR